MGPWRRRTGEKLRKYLKRLRFSGHSSFLTIFKIIKLSATPPSIVFPYPLVPLLALSLSCSKIANFMVSLVFVSTYCGATNLWNHLNDAEIDIKFGREEFKLLLDVKSYLVAFIVILYILALISVFYFSFNPQTACILFGISLILTWMYSDRILIGKSFRRFKEHYVTEILTYLVVLPSSSIVLWSLFSEINMRGIAFALLVTFVYFSLIVLKDIKDLSADEYAGYKTLAVVFPVRSLFKLSIFLGLVCYVFVLVYCLEHVFPPLNLLGLLSLSLFFHSTFKIREGDWRITIGKIKYIKEYVSSYLLFIVLLILANFCSCLNPI